MSANHFRSGICAGSVVLASATPALALQTAPVTHEMVVPAQTKAAACSPAAIREAVDRKVTPAVTGCRYDAVSAPLMSFHILPLPSQVYNDAASGTIVKQTPQAGTPANTGLLLVQVSQGPRPQAETSASASASASSVAAPASSSSAVSVSSASKISASSSSASSLDSSSASAAVSSSSASSSVDGPAPGEIAGLLWNAIVAYPLPAVIAVAIAGLLTALGLGRKTPKIGMAPRVRCELEPGPSRLVLSGPLVLRRKGDA